MRTVPHFYVDYGDRSEVRYKKVVNHEQVPPALGESKALLAIRGLVDALRNTYSNTASNVM